MLATLRRAYRALPLNQRSRAGIRSLLRRLDRLIGPWGSPAYRLPAADAVAPKDPSRPDYVFFSVIDWHFRVQRPQHLAMELAAAGHRVFYVSNEFIEHPRSGFRVEALDAAGRLFQVQLHAKGAPAIYFGTPLPQVERQLKAGLGSFLAWADADQVVGFLQHPFWLFIAGSLGGGKVVYDCMDFHEGFGSFAEDLRLAEEKLLRSADLTVVTSVWLRDFVAPYARRVALVRNAAEYSHFAEPPAQCFRDPRGRAVIGYYGALAEWFDVELVRAVAERFADCLVLLVGRDQARIQRALADLRNIRFLGEVSYEKLPCWLHGFDVCLLPFRIVPLTLATNPVKLYEYLSAGKPVVSVDLPEVRQCEGLVMVAHSTADFLRLVESALAEQGDAAEVAKRQAFAATQTWRERRLELQRAVGP